MKVNQSEIAKKAKISPAMLSMILSGKKRPSWVTAKKLATATGTDPVLWIDGSSNQIREAVVEHFNLREKILPKSKQSREVKIIDAN